MQAPNILYVEDDFDTRELVRTVLGMENFQVTLAQNCDEAMLLARVMRFDLYMMDNWMPGGSGIALCKQLRELDPATPILFYSGAAYDRDIREALAAGAQAYLTKPTDIDTLVETIARLVKAPARAVTVESQKTTKKYKMIAAAFCALCAFLWLLPATAERPVKLDQGKQLVASCLRQA